MGTYSQAIGKSRCGITTRMLAFVDGLGNLVRFLLMTVQCGEVTKVKQLPEGVSCRALFADKAYDADWLRSFLTEHDIEAVIPVRQGQKTPGNA